MRGGPGYCGGSLPIDATAGYWNEGPLRWRQPIVRGAACRVGADGRVTPACVVGRV